MLVDKMNQEDIPFPQVKFVSILPFAPPVPVIDFPLPKPEEFEQLVYQLVNLKNMPGVMELLMLTRG